MLNWIVWLPPRVFAVWIAARRVQGPPLRADWHAAPEPAALGESVSVVTAMVAAWATRPAGRPASSSTLTPSRLSSRRVRRDMATRSLLEGIRPPTDQGREVAA